MGNWIIVKSEAELEAKAKALRKKCRGHYYTNYIFFNSTRDDDLRYTEMFYQEDGDNLYTIERMDDHYQFFYFIGDVGSVRLELPPSVESSVLKCAIPDEEGREKQGLVLEKLYSLGFSNYKKFLYYERKEGNFQRFHREGVDFSYQASVEELSAIYDIFDPYADHLPLRKGFPEFLSLMDIISCTVDGQYAGSYMSHREQGGFGFLFTLDQFRGSGIGVMLVSVWLDRFFQEHPKRICRVTILEDNTDSIRLHTAFGFERTKQYHQILIRGN